LDFRLSQGSVAGKMEMLLTCT